MVYQIILGTGLIIATIIIAAFAFWVLELMLIRLHPWLKREPHRPKLMVVLCITVIWVLGIVTAGVWVWALAMLWLQIFITLEASVYFALVAFTTLGFGDILLPLEWRLLGGMAAANGLLIMGLLTAMLVEVLRQIRLSQLEGRKR